MRNQYHCLFVSRLLQRFQDNAFIQGIQIGCWFIHQKKRAVMEKSSCNSNTLFFTAGKGISQFTDFCIISFRQLHDKIMNRCFAGCFHDLFPGCSWLADSNIICNRIMEQMGFLYILSHRQIMSFYYFPAFIYTSPHNAKTAGSKSLLSFCLYTVICYSATSSGKCHDCLPQF